jgi:hypothetical protein
MDSELVTPDTLPEPIRAAVIVARALDDFGIPYVVGGSLASSLHGEPRLTNDVDFVVRLESRHVGPLVQRLEPDFYVSEDAVRRTIADSGPASFNVIHMSMAVKVDLFPAADALDDQRLSRRRTVDINQGGDPVLLNIDTADDIVLRKLDWYRKGGETSERQWRDVIGVLRAQGSGIDVAYLRKWSGILGISDLLERALEESAP